MEDTDEIAYVVMEWVAGASLLDMLHDGPLDPPRAVSLACEAAQAMTVAHTAGLAHLRLDPSCLHWTANGGVKITGLGMDAALAGTELTGTDTADPALTDTRDLARLLYAGLTGHWPGPGAGRLPAAPETEGVPCTPRQVTGGVPASVDAITCQALLQRPSKYGPALTTPAAFADALATVAPPLPPPAPAPFEPPRETVYPGPMGATNPYPTSGTYQGTGHQAGRGYRRRHPASERSTVTRAVVSAVIVLVLAAVGITAWTLSNSMHHGNPPQAGHHHVAPPSAPRRSCSNRSA